MLRYQEMAAEEQLPAQPWGNQRKGWNYLLVISGRGRGARDPDLRGGGSEQEGRPPALVPRPPRSGHLQLVPGSLEQGRQGGWRVGDDEARSGNLQAGFSCRFRTGCFWGEERGGCRVRGIGKERPSPSTRQPPAGGSCWENLSGNSWQSRNGGPQGPGPDPPT